MRQSNKVMRYSLALIVSLLLLSTTSVAAGSSSTTNSGGTAASLPVSLASFKVSTSAVAILPKTAARKHSARELCVSRHCKQREWLRHHPRPRYIPALRMLSLNSTAYCGGGLTYSEEPTHDGVVAIVKGLPLGHYYQIRSGALRGKVLHGSDYIGSGSEFDVWMSSCSDALTYGSPHIQVAEISSQRARVALAHHH